MEKFFIEFSDNTGFYYYSALAAANVALLVFLGILTYSKSQTISGKISDIKSFFFKGNENIRAFGAEFDLKSNEQKAEYVEKQTFNSAENRLLSEWVANNKVLTVLFNSIKSPVIVLIITILCNILMILLSSSLHDKNKELEIILAGIFFLIELGVIVLIGKRIIKIMKQ